MLFLFSTIILTISSPITSSDTVYQKSYKNLGRVGYYFEYLGDVQRPTKPAIKSENILPIDRIPKYNQNNHLTEEERRLILQENTQLITTNTKTQQGCFDIFDDQGNLYNKGEKLSYSNGTARKLYRHIGDVDHHLGNIADNEPAITKRLTYRSRPNVFSVTGLYAPGGELITVRISKSDLKMIRQLEVSIGPILNNGKANNIWLERNDFVRMPVISNYFLLNEQISPHYGDDNEYVFYIGAFLGGPIYIKNSDDCQKEFTITISGAVRYPHYILGYTSREEFEDNKKSSAPYCDVEVYQHGILHSGPKSYVEQIDYDAFYDAAIYWQKVTSVSSQIPSSFPATISINMMYEPFIAAGAAVAFPGQGTTNCPLSWFTYTTDYKGCLQDSSCDTWGPHHEYHHHFQPSYGLSSVDCGETTNNLITLISYSYFSTVSQRRTENSEPDGDGWNVHSSASWAVKDCITTYHDYHLNFFDIFLHCFGQELLIKAINLENDKSNSKWYNTWTTLTELDFTYFFRHVYNSDAIPIDDSEVNKYIDKDYPNFIPIACKYQTGIGYKIKGQFNKNMRTMYPFLIKKGEDKILDFNKQMVVPNGFSFTIKSFTNPEHGTLTKQQDNIYIYKPDPNHVLSGVMTFTIGLVKVDNPAFKIDDIEIYVELQQTKKIVEKYSNGQDKLDRTIYTYPTDVIPTNPIDEYNNQFAGSISHIKILNNETNDGVNTQIMTLPGANVNNQNRVSVLEGKFEVTAGKYRIALQCRNRGVLYLSYDGGKTYELGCQVLFECADERYYTDHDEIFTTHEFAGSQWVYFKFVVCHKMENNARRMFSKIGLDKYKDDGTVSDSITDLTKSRNVNYEADPTFYSKDFYPTVLTDVKKKEYLTKGSLIETNYEKYPEDKFNIENIFDEDDSNMIHTNTNFISNNPLYLFVDLGEEITVNTMTIYGATQGQWQYQPTSFVLYGGVDRDNLEKITEVNDATVSNYNVQVSFDLKTFRYYKLNITKGRGKFVVFRFIRFSEEHQGTVISLDDDRATLYNGWKKINSPVSTFGSSYESTDSNSKLSLQFTGTGFYINARKNTNYGTFQVFVDDVKKADVDLNGQSTNSDNDVYKIADLQDGKHTLTLVGSNGVYNIDSIMVLREVEPEPEPEPEPTPEPIKTPEATIPPPPEYVEPSVPSSPFETPNPAEIEELLYDRGLIDSRPIENNPVNEKEYSSVVKFDRFYVSGKGHDNLYLSVANNNKKVNVLQTEAKFGIKLDSANKDASIIINQENINMNIKGNGNIKIDTSNEIKNLNLNNIIVSHEETLNVHIIQSLDSFEFNNLNMYGNSAFNPFIANGQNIAKVKSIAIGEGAVAKMSNLQVLNEVNIGMNAVLSLSNIDLNNVNQLNISYSKQSERPSITGRIGNPPKSISLIEHKRNNKLLILEDIKFTIASANKEDFPECKKWKDAVNVADSSIKKIECINVKASNENEKDKIELVVSYSNKGKGKNNAGLIAGVVIAVIVVLAVVGVVVFFVLKKRNVKQSSDIDFAVSV